MPEKIVNFAKNSQRIEEIMSLLERKEVDLDEAVKMYEEALRLIEECKKKLAEAENKIEVIRRKYE